MDAVYNKEDMDTDYDSKDVDSARNADSMGPVYNAEIAVPTIWRLSAWLLSNPRCLYLHLHRQSGLDRSP